jgi:hypothetical protein
MSNTLYDQDFYAWANEQARLLRDGHLTQADIEHIAEEIESMGKTEKRELVSRLEVLLMHLLKWQYQPERRGKSWSNTIRVQRNRIVAHLADNPSLKSQLQAAVWMAYENARIETSAETDLDEALFPETCPWQPEDILTRDFWPDHET